MTNGQMKIGSRSKHITFQSVDVVDEADEVFVTDDELNKDGEDGEDSDGHDNKSRVNNKGKERKAEGDEELSAKIARVASTVDKHSKVTVPVPLQHEHQASLQPSEDDQLSIPILQRREVS